MREGGFSILARKNFDGFQVTTINEYFSLPEWSAMNIGVGKCVESLSGWLNQMTLASGGDRLLQEETCCYVCFLHFFCSCEVKAKGSKEYQTKVMHQNKNLLTLTYRSNNIIMQKLLCFHSLSLRTKLLITMDSLLHFHKS